MSTAAYRERARDTRSRQVTILRAHDDLGTYADLLFAAEPGLVVAVSDLKRRFRDDSTEEYSDPDYRSAYSPAALGRMVRALDGDAALGEDGDPIGTYRIVNHSGRPMLRLEQSPTAGALRVRAHRIRKVSTALTDLPGWLAARKAARTEPEHIADTLATWEDLHGVLADDDYLAVEEIIDRLYPDWETVK